MISAPCGTIWWAASESRPDGKCQVLRLYTQGSSWFSSEGGKKGTIAVGQFADLVALTDDYFSVPEERIKGIQSVLTVVGGKIIHAAEEFARPTFHSSAARVVSYREVRWLWGAPGCSESRTGGSTSGAPTQHAVSPAQARSSARASSVRWFLGLGLRVFRFLSEVHEKDGEQMNSEIVGEASEPMFYTANTTPYSDEWLLALIRARAYELFEIRGRDDGHALDDWIQAEREIKHHLGL